MKWKWRVMLGAAALAAACGVGPAHAGEVDEGAAARNRLIDHLSPPATIRVLGFVPIMSNNRWQNDSATWRWLESRIPVRAFAYRQRWAYGPEEAWNALATYCPTDEMWSQMDRRFYGEALELVNNDRVDVVVAGVALPRLEFFSAYADFVRRGGGMAAFAVPPAENVKALEQTQAPAVAAGPEALRQLLPLAEGSWSLPQDEPLAAANDPLMAGVPVSALAHGKLDVPNYALKEGDRVLLADPAGKPVVVLCRRGKGRVLYSPCGLVPQKGALAQEAWAIFWDRALRELAGREFISPTLEAAPEVRAGSTASVTISSPQAVPCTLSLINQAGTELFSESLTVEGAEEAAVSIERGWGVGEYLVRVQADGPGSLQAASAGAVVTVGKQIALAVALDSPKLGRRPGERFAVKCTITNLAEEPTDEVEVVLALRDLDGLAVASLRKTTGPVPPRGATEASFELTMPDEGVQGWFYWAVVGADAGRHGKAVASTTVERWKKWSPRDEVQWSVWEGAVPYTVTSVTPYVLNLFGDMGINAFGNMVDFNELPYMYRWGWRGYAEVPYYGGFDNIGWPPAEGFDGWREMSTRHNGFARSAAYPLLSYGEEPGFGPAFGTTWHWGDGPAPEGASAWFRNFLKTQYADVAALNKQWETNFASFDEINLEKEYSRPFKHWDAPPAELPENLSRHVDTHAFYHWYIHRIAAEIEKYVRAGNPTHASVMSMDNSFLTTLEFIGMYMHWLYPPALSTSYYAFLSQWTNDDVAFVMNWGFMNNLNFVNQIYACSLVQGATAFSFWYDFPLQFNSDLTHTRAGVHMKALRETLRGKEAAILKPRIIRNPEIGIFIPERPWRAAMGREAWMMGLREEGRRVPWAAGYGGFEQVFFTAMQESGYCPRFVNERTLAGCKLVVAPYIQCLDLEEAAALKEFVRNGGVLVSSAKLATHDAHGKPYEVVPGAGMREAIGASLSRELTGRYGPITPADFAEETPFDFPPGGGHFAGGEPIELQSFCHQEVRQVDDGVQVPARHSDGQPAILLNSYGQGKSIYLNMLYFYGEEWYTGFSQRKEALRLLLKAIADWAGAGPPGYFLERDPPDATVEMHDPLTLAQAYISELPGAEPVRYVRLYRDWRGCAVEDDRLNLRWPVRQVVDVVTGEALPLLIHERNGLKYVPIAIKPGGFRILSLLPEKRGRLTLVPRRRSVDAGARIVLDAQMLDDADDEAKSAHALTLRARRVDPATGRRLGPVRLYDRDLIAAGAVALDFPAHVESGAIQFDLHDSSTGLSASCRVTVTGGEANLPNVDRWQRDDQPGLCGVTAEEFLGYLNALTAIYLDPGSTRLDLDAYTETLNLGRHRILERLARIDWLEHVAALEDALRVGDAIVLLPEDLGTDPRTGIGVTPLDNTFRSELLDLLSRRVAAGADKEREPARMQELRRKLDRKVTFDFLETPLRDVIPFLQTITGATVILDLRATKDLANTDVTLKVTDMKLTTALRWILSPHALDYRLQAGAIFVSTRARLREMKPFDAARLYGEGCPPELRKKLRSKVSFDFVETPLRDVVTFLQQIVGFTIILDPQAILDDRARDVTLKVTDMELAQALHWIVTLQGCEMAVRDEAIVITTAQRAPALKVGALPRTPVQQIGRFRVLRVGNGALVLDSRSPDSEGFTDGHFALWHAEFLRDLKAAGLR